MNFVLRHYRHVLHFWEKELTIYKKVQIIKNNWQYKYELVAHFQTKWEKIDEISIFFFLASHC